MSTPTDVANRVHRNRLSNGRGKVTTPKESRKSNAKTSPGYQKSRSKKSPLAARNANINDAEIKKTTHKVEPIAKPTQAHQTQSKSRFRNLLADSDSDTESEPEIQEVQIRSPSIGDLSQRNNLSKYLIVDVNICMQCMRKYYVHIIFRMSLFWEKVIRFS